MSWVANQGNKGTHDTVYLSALDLNVPQKSMSRVYSTFGDVGDWYMFLNAVGFDNPKKAQTYGHYEKNRQFRSIKCASVSLSDSNRTATVVVSDESLNNSTQSFANYFQVGMSVMWNDVRGFIYSVTESDATSPADGLNETVTIVLKTNKTTTSFVGMTTNSVVAIYSGVSTAEGSKFPTGERPSFDYYSFNMTQKKHVANATDISLATETYIDELNNGGEYQGVYSEAVKDIDTAFLRDRYGSFFFGDSITAGRLADATALGGTRNANEAVGLFASVIANGHSEAYTTTWAITELDAYINNLAADNVSQTVPLAWYQGMSLSQEVATTAATALQNTAVDYTDWVADRVFGDKSLALYFNFSVINRNGYKFLMMPQNAWSQPDFVGVTGAKWTERGIIVPLDKNIDPKTLDTSVKIPSCGLTYLAMGKYNLKMQVGKRQGTGALLPGETANWDYSARQFEGVMNYGTEFFGTKRMIYTYK